MATQFNSSYFSRKMCIKESDISCMFNTRATTLNKYKSAHFDY